MGPTETVPGRSFTDVSLTDRDVSILYQILGDLRGVLKEIEAGEKSFVPYEKMSWDVDGLSHRLLICDESRLRDRDKTCVVGFFGERVQGVDPTPLEEANTGIVAEFGQYPGILSYSSVQIPGGHWANLVLHDDPIDREYWRRSQLHARAVEMLSPVHYYNVRIHNAELIGSLIGEPRLRVLRTKYYDYSGKSEWRAERELVG